MMKRRPTIPRSRSTPRIHLRSSSERPCRVDNSFQTDYDLPASRAQVRYCHSYVQELGRLRQATEFEVSNQKRLMRRQYFAAEAESKKLPPYSQGGASYTIRPPTGVDLALGLSGYDKLGNDFPAHKQRPPSTLQPLKDEDEEMKRRVASLDSQEAKWERIREEVEERRQREKREHDNYVAEAKRHQFQENNEEAREEVTRQLGKAMIEDWDYQKELKNRREISEKDREFQAGLQDIQVNNETLEQEALKARNLESQRQLDRQMELSNRAHVKFQEGVCQDRENNQIVAQYSRENAKIQLDDQRLKESQTRAKMAAKESLESQISKKQNDASLQKYLDNKAGTYKIQENKEIQGYHQSAEKDAIGNNAVNRDEYMRYNADLDQTKQNTEKNADVVRSGTNYQLTHHAHDQVVNQERYRKEVNNEFTNQVWRQIEDHNKAKAAEKDEKRLEQDLRLEAEKNYKAEEQVAKDRRAREQKAYRDFLFTQMNERKARDDHRRWQENVYLENRMLATNDRNDAVKKHVDGIDVNTIQQQSRNDQPSMSAQMT